MIRKLATLVLGLALFLAGCELPARETVVSTPPKPTVTFMPVTPLVGGPPVFLTDTPEDQVYGTQPAVPISQDGFPVPTERVEPTAPDLNQTEAPSNLQPTSNPTQAAPFYGIQPGSPIPVPGFPHPEMGCSWMGVGGQVFDYSSKPVELLVVQLKGTLGSTTVDQISITGTAKAWGPGGYEFKINDKPVETSGTLYLQFLDLSGTPVSNPVYFTTYPDCNRNSILLNMVQIGGARAINNVYFPSVIGK